MMTNESRSPAPLNSAPGNVHDEPVNDDAVGQPDAAPEHNLATALDIESSDWTSAVSEWRAASQEVEQAIDALDWPTPTVTAVDAWLAAVNRQNIAHTRCAALCEIQLQKNRPIK